MQSKLLLAAAAATGAMAFEMSGTLPRVLRRAGNDALEARDKTACASVWMAHSTIVDDFPTEPTALATETNLDIPQITDPCVFPSITGQAGQIITSYSSALQSWQDAHITEIRDIYSACSDVPEVASALDAYGSAICSTALAVLTSGDATATATGSGSAATATGTASGSASASATASRSGSSASASGASASGSAASTTAAAAAAAPRETGLFVAAAAAAAGIVGAIVL
ncbi:hypothetical protein CABS01_10346 [Colletotrichum abscissum]|uniref:Infection structure specific protein n=5 Tax=Colletotrichum acutatum species complex TaxID=2707335 RepID=A0A9P9XP92_9PEZI|nr:uncharacterized protein CLUP02_17807 [Colletotrichum lupini]XP_060317016.1 uncharacterized protein CCOS01_04877 [Colletotrichum costaricense]XP_060386405.1 uncharacterized protein CTAM01_02564 [Colletotrichum tamarilloi]XP_060399384.1 uncharacterized protein CABS01_10346 [Colletotrichum abscissum]KAK1446476.1 hypothetical protein CCUS01_12441 [Colletotrichum cuscutae]KAI3557106.1 hypothetical protein CABS02_02657 [Colletotrichum abscissum]KAK1499948.1 hypothetical protein CABS01_10346 [Col